MHLSDALLSPQVGGATLTIAIAAIGYASRRINEDGDDRRVPLMGALGAFVFAAQMINFSIPGTGSSGHLTGGLLLAILVGPHAAFIVMTSILVVQALFFADGGLLAIGCNAINLGIVPAFVGYPIYQLMSRREPGAVSRLATIVGAVAAAQVGALAVVLQVTASGRSAIPIEPFLALMLPINTVTGIVEGLATAAILRSIRSSRPDMYDANSHRREGSRAACTVLGGATLACCCFGVWIASARPDALTSYSNRTSAITAAGSRPSVTHDFTQTVQSRTALLPGYAFPEDSAVGRRHEQSGPNPKKSLPLRAGTVIAGLVGSAISLAVVLLLATALRGRLGRRGLQSRL